MCEKILSPIKAIRANCIECSCGSKDEVKLCPIQTCPLYPYRLGKNPNRKMSEEQLEKARERITKLQEEGKFRKKIEK